jgi:hypothetical protein
MFLYYSIFMQYASTSYKKVEGYAIVVFDI